MDTTSELSSKYAAPSSSARAVFPTEAIYDSPVAFETYLADVRRRREHRRAEREKRRHWETALQKIVNEIQAARQDNDTDIVAELETVAHRLEAMMGGLPPVPVRETMSAPLPPPPVAERAPAPHVPEERYRMTARTPQLSPEEREALRKRLTADLESLTASYEKLKEEGFIYEERGGHNRPQLFRLRALACEADRIRAQAREGGIERDALPAINRLMDSLHYEREWANDRWESFPFDEDYWQGPTTPMTPAHWGDLAQRYRNIAEAEAAWEWYEENWEGLPSETRLSMLNGIAAAQQALYRSLSRVNGWERMQEDLYKSVKEIAGQVGYLTAMNFNTSLDDLDALARSLPELRQSVLTDIAERQERETRQARQEATIAAVLELCKKEPQLGGDEERRARDRALLLPLLDECLIAGVPTSNKPIRDALIECGPLLLDTEGRHARFLEAVLEERRRRGMDASPPSGEEDVPDEEGGDANPLMENFKETLRPFAAGKRLLILGGTPRPRLSEELTQELGFAEVKWPESDKNDTINKFENEIKKSDILIVLKNFASHEMSDKGKEWIRSVGGQFLLLPSGYGVNQVIFQLYKFVTGDYSRK